MSLGQLLINTLIQAETPEVRRWSDFCERIGAEDNYYRHFSDIVHMYSEPGRFYHDLDHVMHCLDEFEEVRQTADYPHELEMALWLHDVIYVPVIGPKKFNLSKLLPHFMISDESARQLASSIKPKDMAGWLEDLTFPKDNEERSADFAYDIALKMNLPATFAQLVHDYVMATTHRGLSDINDHRLIADIDLAILGQPVDVFDRYEENIRKEYIIVPIQAYKKGRSDVLQGFLDRENIYQTEYFREKYKEQARDNLERSINKLR